MAVPKKIGKYEIFSELGKGAMGMVYRARDVRLGRLVALKTMLEGVDKDEELVKRFNIEAQAAAQLNHENVITIYDLGEEGNVYYIAMEFLEGDDLKAVLQKKKLSLPEKLNIILQICSGLEYAHKMGVVHRDVKPANVMVLGTGKIKLMDFGIAHMASSEMTRTGMIIGTPDYMSPEQVMGKKIDNRSDIFSTGVIFYEMMSGKKPFTSDSVTSILYKIAHEPIPAFEEIGVEVPIEIETVINKATEKEPEKRYQTMNEMIKDLKAVIDLFGEQKMATMPSLHNEIKKLIDEGKALMKARKFQNAAEIYNKALALDPDNSVLKRLLEKVESELIKTKMSDIEGILKESERLTAEKRFTEALKVAESSFEILPDNTNARIMVTKIQEQAASHEKQQLFENQEKKIKSLIKDEKFSDAAKEIELLNKIQPGNKTSSQLLEEINAAKAATEDQKQISMILSYVQENIRKENYAEAKKSIQAALKIDPQNKVALSLEEKIEKLDAKQAETFAKKTTVKAPAPTRAESGMATVVDESLGKGDASSFGTVIDDSTTSQATIAAARDKSETIAATKYAAREEKRYPARKAETPKAREGKSSAMPMILVVVAVIVIAASILYFVVFKKPSIPDRIGGNTSTVYLSILPWAKIESLVDSENKAVAISTETVPCMLSLPDGEYTLQISNQELGINNKTIKFSVSGGEKTVIENLAEMKPEDFMKELKLE
jgi:serine/threonine protein kinase